MINYTYVDVSSVKLIPDNTRPIFFWIIFIILIVTLIGNSFAIGSVAKRKQICLQKVCVISLALADIFSVLMFATNNLESLSKELKVWSLGDFLCSFIPMGQVLGTTASSFALLAIAVDRYQNVTVSIVSQRWNPNIWKCMFAAFLSWIVSAATAVPMFILFNNNPIRIVHTKGAEPVFEDAHMCIAIKKRGLMLYYIIMAVFIFLPIIVTFIWFYYKIAVLIWRHRKPPSGKSGKKKKTDEASTTADINDKVCKISLEANPKSIIKKMKNVQMQRKIRTFKVVIVLMMAFTVCRLPYWVYFVVKLITTIKGGIMWDLNYALTALNILNCALNPFLYAFLNETISAAKKIHDFTCKVILYCCCFTNAEFKDFERNNPFPIICEQRKYVVQSHRNVKNARVKFMDVAHLSIYMEGYLPNKET